MDNRRWTMDGNNVFLATKVAWRRKEGKYKVGVISTPYNSNPTSRGNLRDGNPKNLLGPSRPPTSFLSTPGSWCRVFTHTTTLILVQSFRPHHYPNPGAEFSLTPHLLHIPAHMTHTRSLSLHSPLAQPPSLARLRVRSTLSATGFLDRSVAVTPYSTYFRLGFNA